MSSLWVLPFRSLIPYYFQIEVEACTAPVITVIQSGGRGPAVGATEPSKTCSFTSPTHDEMPTATQAALPLLALLAVTNAHPHPVESEESCTCEPGAKAFESYHIHVLFYPEDTSGGGFSNNPHNSKNARALRAAFMHRFNITTCDEKSSIFNLTTLCAFAVDATGAGYPINAAPFVAPNWAVFLPVDRYHDVVPWMMANRGELDFLVHPNSCGFKCSPQDHLKWSIWGGNKWPVRFEL